DLGTDLAKFDFEVAARYPPQLLKRPHKQVDPRLRLRIIRCESGEHSDTAYRVGGLRAYFLRPHRGTAQQRKEVAPLHPPPCLRPTLTPFGNRTNGKCLIAWATKVSQGSRASSPSPARCRLWVATGRRARPHPRPLWARTGHPASFSHEGSPAERNA